VPTAKYWPSDSISPVVAQLSPGYVRLDFSGRYAVGVTGSCRQACSRREPAGVRWGKAGAVQRASARIAGVGRQTSALLQHVRSPPAAGGRKVAPRPFVWLRAATPGRLQDLTPGALFTRRGGLLLLLVVLLPAGSSRHFGAWCSGCWGYTRRC